MPPRTHLVLAATLAALLIVAPAPPAEAQDVDVEELLERLRKSSEESKKRLEEIMKKADAERRRKGTRGTWGVSPDGLLVAAGTPEGHVEVWKAWEKRPTIILKGHDDFVTGVAISTTRTHLYAVARDGTLRGWNIETGDEAFKLGEPNRKMDVGGTEFPVGYVEVALSPDGRFSAFGRSVLGINVWDRKRRGYLEDDLGFASASECPPCRRGAETRGRRGSGRQPRLD